MKVFGDITKLDELKFVADTFDITLKPNASTTYTAARTLSLPNTNASDELTSNAATQTLTNKTLTSPKLTDAGAGDLIITSSNGALASDRTLSINVQDADRTISLAGNLTLAGAFSTSGANALTLTTTGATNVTLPTSGTLATVAYVDAATAAQNEADEITFDNATSGLAATDVQAAIDEVEARLATAESDILGQDDASEITYTPAVLADWETSTDPGNVDDALDQLAARTLTSEENISTLNSEIATVSTDLDNHIGSTAAHGATGAVVGTTNTQTLTNKTLTSPKINEDVALTTTATELNYVDGVTSNIQTQLDGKVSDAGDTMTGHLNMDNQQAVRFMEQDGNGSHYIGLKAPDAVTASIDFKLPDGDGNSGEVLSTDGSGNLEWAVVATVSNNLLTTITTGSYTTNAYSITDSDNIRTLVAPTDTTNRTINLPAAANNTNRIITVKKSDSASGSLTIDPNSTETIDTASTIILRNQNDFITIQSDGTNWQIIAAKLRKRWQKKTRASAIASDGAIPELTFSNLVVGKFYTATYNGQLKSDQSAGTSGEAVVDITHDSTVMATARIQHIDASSGGNDCYVTCSAVAEFVATATTVTFVLNVTSANDAAQNSIATLMEDDDVVSVSAF